MSREKDVKIQANESEYGSIKFKNVWAHKFNHQYGVCLYTESKCDVKFSKLEIAVEFYLIFVPLKTTER